MPQSVRPLYFHTSALFVLPQAKNPGKGASMSSRWGVLSRTDLSMTINKWLLKFTMGIDGPVLQSLEWPMLDVSRNAKVTSKTCLDLVNNRPYEVFIIFVEQERWLRLFDKESSIEICGHEGRDTTTKYNIFTHLTSIIGPSEHISCDTAVCKVVRADVGSLYITHSQIQKPQTSHPTKFTYQIPL